MPTTSNFGWTTPADTDLVKDGAAAIRTLGSGIDTSFLDLKGGTTDQVLAKNSNTDLDFKWVAPAGDSNFTLLNSGSTSMSGSTFTVSSLTSGKLAILITGASSTNAGGMYLRFNSDTASNYRWVAFKISGASSAALENSTSATEILLPYVNSATRSFAAIIEIDGAGTSGIKTGSYTCMVNAATTGDDSYTGNFIYVGSAISSINIVAQAGTFDSGTCSVYGD